VNTLESLSTHHKLWLSYTISFGCNKDTAEDIVMEMYLKVNEYVESAKKNIIFEDTGQINYFFIYVTLKNMFLDLKRKEKRIKMVPLETYDKIEEDIIPDKNLDYDKFRVIEKYLLNQDYLDLTTEHVKEYTNKQFGAFYKCKIFEEVFIEGKSISQFSRDSGISYYSLYNTIKNIKKDLKNEYKIRKHR
jgi:DNA-directed RNA polymerase specialized sigma24 family protein